MGKLQIAYAASFREPLIHKSPSWQQLMRVLDRKPDVGNKEGPYIVPAKIEGEKRRLENVIHVSLVMLDLDNKNNKLSTERLNDCLSASGLKCAYHTTHSSTKEHPRFRVIVDVSRVISKSEFKKVAVTLAHSLGLEPDPQAMDASRAFYLPRCPAGLQGDYVFREFEGVPLDVDQILISVPAQHETTEQPLKLAETEFYSSDQIRGLLVQIPAETQRDDWMKTLWSIRALGLKDGRTIALHWSRTATKYWNAANADTSMKDFNRIWDDYDPNRRENLGLDWLIRKATDHGWCQSKIDRTVLRPTGFQLLSPQSIRSLPDMQWAIKNLLPARGLCAIYGPSKSGKSFLAIDMALHLSEGISSWFGAKVSKTDVAYLVLEGEAGLKKRMRAWEIHNGREVEQARFSVQPFDLKSPDDVTNLIASLKATLEPGAAVFIDTLNQASPGTDENSSTDMGLLISAAKRIMAAIDGLVVLIHHTGKDASKGLRGHSSLGAALDFSINVEHKRNSRKWAIGKIKDGDDSRSHGFELVSIEVGIDEDGEAITSCAVKQQSIFKAARKPTGKNQIIAYEAINVRLVGGPLRQSEALDIIKQALLDGEGPPTKSRAASRAKEALEGLLDSEFLFENDGMIDSPE